MKCKKIILKKAFVGLPKFSDFEIVEEEVSEDLNDGEFLYESQYISVDPYIRAYADAGAYKEGDTVIGLVLARVTKSRNAKYPTGHKLVVGCGWRSGGKSSGGDVSYSRDDMPDSVPPSAGLGIYGVPGLATYIGLVDICKIKAGETVFINGSAGAVGTTAGQIAKTKGCKVIGCCGSDKKVDFAKSVGYDDVFNYKSEANLDEAIKRMAPEGIDCYFDNVGGQFSSTLLQHMNKYGRVAVCGSISSYNATEPVKADIIQPALVLKELMMKGFLLWSYESKYEEIYNALKEITVQGNLKCYETITEGFENLPKAFIGMLQGGNIGKAVVKV